MSYGRRRIMAFATKLLHFHYLLPFLAVATVVAANDEGVVDAAKQGDFSAVQALIEQQVDVNEVQPDGATALHWAAYRGDLQTAKLLISAEADVNAANDYGATPLWLAAQDGNVAMVQELLQAGADASAAFPSGETILMTAAQGGNAAIVKHLLDHGADINATESNMGQNALMWAIADKHTDVVQVLVEYGADVQAPSTSGFSPYLFAARFGDIETAKYLAMNGADPASTTEDGTTALHVAVIRGHLPFAKYLLDIGMDPNANGPGYTALHWVVGQWESIFTYNFVFSPQAATLNPEWSVLGGLPTFDDKADMIKSLLDAGADINAPITGMPPPRFGASIFPINYLFGATPFYVATTTADLPIMRLLLDAGADPMIGAKDGSTVLMAAAGLARVDSETTIPESRLIEAIELALELGHDINAANASGTTAMHAAATQGLDTVTQFLYDHGADVNPKDKKCETPTKIADGYEFAGMVYNRPSTAALLRTLGGVAEGPCEAPPEEPAQ